MLRPGDIVYVQRATAPRQDAQPILTNKVAIEQGDLVECILDPGFMSSPGAERMRSFTQRQRIGNDGTIITPYIGPIHVLGLRTKELEKLLNKQYEQMFAVDVQIQARVSRAR